MYLCRRILAAATFALAAGYCLPVSAEDGRVGNGEEAERCAFPTTVYIGQCTATLIHPKVVVFAAHCDAQPELGHVRFGENEQTGFTVETERCEIKPNWSVSEVDDWAYCLLKEPVDLPITPIMRRSCAEDHLEANGAKAMMVGFGDNREFGGLGTKRWAWSEVRQVNWDRNVLEIGYGSQETPGTACAGDSGGPALIQMDDGTWWSVAIASKIFGECAGNSSYNTYSLLEDAIEWLEEASGEDLTPCFDDEGNWEASPECTNVFAANEGKGTGTWDGAPCEGTPVVNAPTTCGPNPNDNGNAGAGAGGAAGSAGSAGMGNGGAAAGAGGSAGAGGAVNNGGTGGQTAGAAGGMTAGAAGGTSGPNTGGVAGATPGGIGGAAGNGGEAPSDPSLGPVIESTAEASGGCSCKTQRHAPNGVGSATLLALGLIVGARRRRTRCRVGT